MHQHVNKLEIHRQTDLQTNIHLAVYILATLCRVQDNQDSHQGGQNNHQDSQDNQDSHQVSQEIELSKQEMELFL